MADSYSLIIAIDPGLSMGIAWAGRFQEGTLANVGAGKALPPTPTSLLHPDEPIYLIVERPTIYARRGGKKQASPDNMLTLAMTAGRLLERCETWARKWYPSNPISARYVEPRTWKGSIDKDVHQTRETSAPAFRHLWPGLNADAKDAALLLEWFASLTPTQREILTKKVKV